MPPTFGPGKICYLMIPALDVERSAAFYHNVFGWNIRHRSDGNIAFDDGVGEVSGTWITNQPPHVDSGLRIFIMVDDVELTLERIVAHNGTIVAPIGVDAPEITAVFRDPVGNVFSVFQQ